MPYRVYPAKAQPKPENVKEQVLVGQFLQDTLKAPYFAHALVIPSEIYLIFKDKKIIANTYVDEWGNQGLNVWHYDYNETVYGFAEMYEAAHPENQTLGVHLKE